MSVRSSVSSQTGFTPFELEWGIPFPAPGADNLLASSAPFRTYIVSLMLNELKA